MRADSSVNGLRPRVVVRAFLALAMALTATVFVPAGAEQLAHLNVTSFTMQSDTPHPQVEVPFHIVFSIHVAQNVGQLQNIVLPAFGPLEIGGDEQHLSGTSGGSDYREIVTVVAHQTGHISIAAAYMDAIDARDGKPKRFLSTTPSGKDTIELDVVGGALEPITPDSGPALLRGVMRALSFLGGLIIIVLLAATVLWLRRPALPQPKDETREPEPVAVQSPKRSLADVARELRITPTRERAVGARAELWRSIGAPEGATLNDVLAKTPTRDTQLSALLRASERAAFTHDVDLSAAIDRFVQLLEAYDL